MTKAEIINKIAEETGVAKRDVAMSVEAFMEEIRVSLADNKENVYLRGFGTFVVKRRAKKTARNISKNTTIVIDAHDFPAFKPSKSFIEKCQTERKRRATRWLLTSVRRDCARIVTRASNHLQVTQNRNERSVHANPLADSGTPF